MKKKKRDFKTFTIVILLAMLVVGWFPTTVLAANPLQGQLPPVEVKLEGSVPSPAEEYQIVLKPGKDAYPMPAGTVDGKYALTVKGSGTGTFPAITWTQPGVYIYTVTQAKGSNSLCTYDGTEYTVKVYITNRQDGNGMQSEIVLSVPGTDGKLYEVVFLNKYSAPSPGPSDNPEDSTPEPSPVPSDDPENPSPEPSNPNEGKTGDSAQIWKYVFLCAISLSVIVVLIVARRRQSEK